MILIVGIGRPFLYAYSAYGQEGVERALQILHVGIISVGHAEQEPDLVAFSMCRTSSR